MRLPWPLLWALSLCLLSGCQWDRTPDLVAVAGLAPDRVEVGDRLEIHGDGFAQGKPATVRFVGQAFRPGAMPVDVDLVLDGRASSSKVVELGVSPRLEMEVCGGREEAAQHATLRGSVTVAFRPRERGSPPVRGTLHDVVLDVFPRARSAGDVRKWRRDGHHVLNFLGVAEAEVTRYGLRVRELVPGGQALNSGLHIGDTITEFGGVRVFDQADVKPSAAVRLVDVEVVRTSGTTERVRFDLDGFEPTVPTTLRTGSWILGAAGFGLWIWFLGGGRLVTWVQWRRLRSAEAAAASGPNPSQRKVPTFVRLVNIGALVVATGAVLLPALGWRWVSRDADFLFVYAGATTMLSVGLFISGGQLRRGWSFRNGFLALVRTGVVLLPGYSVLATIIACEAAANLGELVMSQGALPWQWRVFDSPLQSIAFLLWMLGALPSPERASGTLGSATWGTSSRRLSPVLAIVAALHTQLVCCFGAAAFLGGWQLFDDSGAPTPMGACLFVAKSAALFVGLDLLRRGSSLTRLSDFAPLAARWAVPAAAFVLLLVPDWGLFVPHPLLQWLAAWARPLSFALPLMAVVAYLVLRSRRFCTGHGSAVNPWL